MKNRYKTIIGTLCLCFFFASCVQVKPYQKMYLDDADMKLSAQEVESYETSFQNYREAASGGASIEAAGGGCGCN